MYTLSLRKDEKTAIPVMYRLPFLLLVFMPGRIQKAGSSNYPATCIHGKHGRNLRNHFTDKDTHQQ
jgi:hypothetical protein